MSELQQVHVRVNDAATGKPTPCRVRFTDAQGKYYAPLGRLTEFATAFGVEVGGNVLLDNKQYAYIDGACEIQLPQGRILIEVHKGPEYKPLHVDHHLIAGKLALRLTMERWIDLRRQGWYSGDMRCHFLTPHAALLEGQAEDLAVVNLLALECRLPEPDLAGKLIERSVWATPNLLAFSGQQPALTAPDCMVVVNTLNWHPWLGQLALLNCHRVVYPLRFGEPACDDWTLADWCDQCHRKGGLTIGTDTRHELCETLANAVLGRIDALEIDEQGFAGGPWRRLTPWLWLAGVAVTDVGASGKASNTQLLGRPRTYAYLAADQQPQYGAWIEAVRAGRVCVSLGPCILFTVDGKPPGSTCDLSDAPQRVHVRAEVASWQPFHRLELRGPSKVWAVADASGSPATARIEAEIEVDDSTWIQAWCYASPDDLVPLAFSAPVYVCVKRRPIPVADPTHGFLQVRLHGALGHVERKGRFSNPSQHVRLRKVFEDALQVLQKRAPV